MRVKRKLYVNSLSPEDRLRLVQSAQPTNMILGSDEMSIYAYKLALMFKDKKDGNINLIISNLYDKVNDRLNAVQYAETARHYFLKNKMESKVSDAEENIKRLKRKYGMKTAS